MKLLDRFRRWLFSDPSPVASWVRFRRDGSAHVDMADPAWQAKVKEQCDRLLEIEKSNEFFRKGRMPND